jgi:hypothetical protein
LALDFTTAVTDPRVVTTRALNTATRVNSSGFIEIVNADLARYDFDPVTKICRGQLIEESRANLLLRSQEFNDAAWLKVSSLTVTANQIIAPDGLLTGDLLLKSATALQAVYQSYTYSGTTTVTESVYAKKGNTDYIAFTNDATCVLTVDLRTGTITRNTSFSNVTVTSADNGWYRISYTRTRNAGAAPVLYMWPTDIADSAGFTTTSSTASCYVWGAQLEAGAFATSYIPTTTTSLTRNADAVSMTGTNFSSWYNQTQGAIVIGGDVLRAPTGVVQFATLFQDYSNFIRIRCVSSSTPEGNIFSGGSSVMELTSGNISSNTPFKVALAYAANNGNFGLNGTHAITDTSVTLPTPTLLAIGALDAFASGVMSGHIAFIDYYPQRIINPEIAAFSK